MQGDQAHERGRLIVDNESDLRIPHFAPPFESVRKFVEEKLLVVVGPPNPSHDQRRLVSNWQFPVGCVHRLLKKGNYTTRIGAGAPGKSCIIESFLF